MSLDLGAINPMLSGNEQPIRVLCVDDSASIIALLKAILAPKYGFSVVGTAENGKIAATMVKDLKPDVMTLDIHMPELDGVSYMEHHFNKDAHPPVIMISSVAREEAELAQRAIRAGASDYVEKPAFNNLNHHAEEIRGKIQMAHKMRQMSLTANEYDKGSGTNTASKSNKMVRIVVVNESTASQLNLFFSQIQGDQPPTIVLIDAPSERIGDLAQKVKCGTYQCRGIISDGSTLQLSEVGIMPFENGWQACVKVYGARKAGICILGYPSPKVVQSLLDWKEAVLIIEDLPLGDEKAYQQLKQMAKDCMPVHSMAYMSVKLVS